MKSTTKFVLIAAGVILLIILVAYLRGSAGREAFEGSFVTGYEGDFTKLSYELPYDPAMFEISAESRKIILKELQSGAGHEVEFFWNGAAGFESARAFWDERGFCENCVEATSTLTIREVKDISAFADEESLTAWFVGSYKDYFVILKLAMPYEKARAVVEGMRLKTEVAEPPEEVTNPVDTIALKIFFMNPKLTPTETCREVVAVERVVPKTPGVARAALELLLAGPTRADLGEGYISNIPTGSVLNSLTIVNGEARADFNAVTESGGGSCSMAARVAQITETLKQFPTVKSVRLLVEGRTGSMIFQP